jgi:hypothetical protein
VFSTDCSFLCSKLVPTYRKTDEKPCSKPRSPIYVGTYRVGKSRTALCRKNSFFLISAEKRTGINTFFPCSPAVEKTAFFGKKRKTAGIDGKADFSSTGKDTKETPYAQEKIPGDARNTSLRGDFYSLDSLYYGYCILLLYIYIHI